MKNGDIFICLNDVKGYHFDPDEKRFLKGESYKLTVHDEFGKTYRYVTHPSNSSYTCDVSWDHFLEHFMDFEDFISSKISKLI